MSPHLSEHSSERNPLDAFLNRGFPPRRRLQRFIASKARVARRWASWAPTCSLTHAWRKLEPKVLMASAVKPWVPATSLNALFLAAADFDLGGPLGNAFAASKAWSARM